MSASILNLKHQLLTCDRLGDQHKANGTTTQNPFEEQKPQISNYTAQEIATLASRLNQRLGPEYISTRAGPGNTRVAYLSAEKAINLANEVFGFNGWSSSIQNIQIDFVDENPTKGTISIGLSVVVRITLKDGTYHEDTGYGGIENCKSKIAAFEKAKKEGTTDALKRALRNFGNVLGNCIYDKEYITKVSKIKAGTGRWDVNDLHRHRDWLPKKEEEPDKKPVNSIPLQQPPSLIPEESFDTNEFDDADFVDIGNPDMVMLPPDPVAQQRGGPQQPENRVPPNHQMTPSKPPQFRPNQQHHNPQQNGNRQPPHLRNGPADANSSVHDSTNTVAQSRSSSPGIASQNFVPPQAPPGPHSIGFFSAKAADALDGNNNPTVPIAVPKFNPHAESPSIRKTSGVDHSKSLALNRTTLKPEPLVPKEDSESGATAAKSSGPVMKGIAEQPAGRRLAPGAAGMSPRPVGGMTSAYRPPIRHGPLGGTSTVNSPAAPNSEERVNTAAKRAPLGDLSNVPHGGSMDGGDVKRQRIGPGLSGSGTGNAENMMPG